VGQVLDGQFRVDLHVGEGGFSVVYKGTHVGLSEPIAIKCLKLPHALGSALVDSFVRRFRDESRLHYKLSQGNLHIARSIASGTTIAPATSALVPYTVLEWLDGRSLADEFNERRDAGKNGRPLREVIALLDSAVDALAFAHAQGVVHRDLNPGNFFLARTPAGIKLKILDFGVAKVMADSALLMGPPTRTVGNVRMFAPAYGAPEQFDDRVGAIGPSTDVYTVALVVLEALTDRTVVEGDHLGEYAMRALDTKKRPSPRSLGTPVGDETEKVFLQALQVDPSRRPRDAGEFWGLLKHAIQVDARSGRQPHAIRHDDAPSTLRMSKEVLSALAGANNSAHAASSSSNPPPATSARPSALGGTLRMDRSSASDWLAATPAASRALSPPPARTSTPPADGAAARAIRTPLPASSNVLPPSNLQAGLEAEGTPLPALAPPGRMPTPIDLAPPAGAEKGGGFSLVVIVAVTLLALGALAGIGWYTLRTPPTPASAPAAHT
jgi:serine/threonine-protein kinase